MLPTLHFSIEKWKWNDEWGVWVSTHGRFRDRLKRPMTLRLNGHGYYTLFVPDHKPALALAHRIVLKTWMPVENDEDLTVDHLDNNRRNICLSNLEWVTKDENQKRAAAHTIAVPDEYDVSGIEKIVWADVTFDIGEFCKLMHKLYNGEKLTLTEHREITLRWLKQRKDRIFGQEVIYIPKRKE
jgi:hypothetical protein